MVAEQSPLLIDFLQNLYNERKKLIDGEISMILLLKKVHNIQRPMRNINNRMLNYTRLNFFYRLRMLSRKVIGKEKSCV